jgi:acyl carrier protein
MNKIDNKLKEIIKKTFPKVKIPVKKSLKAGDFEQWDSLGHLNFLLAVEKFYKIKFTMEEMIKIKTFDEILKILKKKGSKKNNEI